MKISTAMNHSKRLLGIANDIYYFCRSCGWSHKKLLNVLKERVHSDPAWKKVPKWVRHSVTNLTGFLSHNLYMPSLHAKELERLLDQARRGIPIVPVAYLRWTLRVDGIELNTNEICKRRKAGDENIWQRVEGAHVWNHKPNNPFSPWTNTARQNKRAM